MLNRLHNSQLHLLISNFLRLINSYLFFLVDTDWGANLQHSIFNINAQHNRVTFAESCDLLENAREHSLFTFFFPPPLFYVLNVLIEEVSQVVNDIGSKNFDSIFFSILLGISQDFDIEH